jgi:DNA replication and repair protein RecF
MRILSLEIRNFRNIEAASLEFPPGPQLLIGKNAQGKTSLLEAIYFLATATSHRTRRNRELIRKGSPAAFVKAEFESAGRLTTLSGGIDEKTRRFRLDGQQLSRSSDLYGHLRAVFFSPEDLEIVSGGPGHRRRLLDLGMCQKYPEMVQVLLDYRRALRQRNALLKGRHNDRSSLAATLQSWDPQLANLGGQIIKRRAVYALSLIESAQTHYSAITGTGEDLTGEYRCTGTRESLKEVVQIPDVTDLQADFLENLSGNLDHDLTMKATTAGPHRDDLNLRVAGISATRYASQGQRRSVALAVKLAEGDLLIDNDDPPILLVDDVTHEMDAGRCSRFLERVAGRGQTFLTFTEMSEKTAPLDEKRVWEVEAGAFL